MALSLAAVIALQIAMTWGRLGAPFLDTRLHYSFDNAEFGFRIRNGIRNGDLRSQFGVTANTYDRWGERVGGPLYYTDHPFLMKAALQQYGRIVGVTEWATRSFYLLVAIATVAGLYAILVRTTRNLFASAAGAATLVTLPLFSVYQTSVKFETDGMLVAVWIFAAFAAFVETGSPAARRAFLLLVAAAFLTHWTSILFVAGLALCQLVLARRLPRARELLRPTAVAAAVGFAGLVAAMSFVQGGFGGAWGALARSFGVRSAPVPAAAWSARQLLYVRKNFTSTAAIASVAMLALAAVRLRTPGTGRRRSEGTPDPAGPRLLAGFMAVTAGVAAAWVLLFPQGSFVHVYWQYWFCLPIAALVAATVAAAEAAWRGRLVVRLAAAALVAFLFLASRDAWAGIAADQLGTADDIAFLRSLKDDRFDRFVFVPVTDTPLTEWFQGPLFLYYTDRPVGVADRPDGLRRGNKLLVLRYTDRPLVVRRLQDWAGRRLTNERCGLRLCAYDVE